nr:hypothetical protein [Kribbella qitaiheensis]
MVGQQPAGDGVQPGQGLGTGWYVGKASPGDQEGLGDQITGVVAAADPSEQVAEDLVVLIQEQLLEPDLGGS